MQVTFLGSGDAFGSGGRFNTSFLVAAQRGNFLIDCGASSVARGTGAMVLGHPPNALFWLAVALQSRGEKLLRGALILTGTCTGITKVGTGQEFAGLFADFEPVRVRLA